METSNNSPGQNLNPSISSAEGSPVRTSAKPESEQVLKALVAAFGLSMPVSLGNLDPDTCSLKTSQACLFTTQCEEYSESFPDSGMMLSGEVFELRSSGLPISESESLSWPTPRTTDRNSGRGCVQIGNGLYRPSPALKRGELIGQANLSDAAEVWPTPNTGESITGHGRRGGKQGNGHQSGADLGVVAAMWPTPTEDNANNAGGPSRTRGMLNGGYVDLTVAVGLWATPQAHDGHGPKTPEQIQAMREKNGAGVRNLNEDVAMWQTPATDSFRSRGGDRKDEMGLDQQARAFPSSHRDHQTPDGPQSSPNVPTSRRRLNPRFVEWLMGFPIGHTEL